MHSMCLIIKYFDLVTFLFLLLLIQLFIGFSLAGFLSFTLACHSLAKHFVSMVLREQTISEPFPELYSGSVHKVLKYNRKYKIMFNKRKKKNKTQCLCTIFINNKDSFLNIFYSEVFDCLYLHLHF